MQRGLGAPLGCHLGAALERVAPDAGEGSSAGIVVGDSNGHVQIHDRVPPASRHEHSLSWALHTLRLRHGHVG